MPLAGARLTSIWLQADERLLSLAHVCDVRMTMCWEEVVECQAGRMHRQKHAEFRFSAPAGGTCRLRPSVGEFGRSLIAPVDEVVLCPCWTCCSFYHELHLLINVSRTRTITSKAPAVRRRGHGVTELPCLLGSANSWSNFCYHGICLSKSMFFEVTLLARTGRNEVRCNYFGLEASLFA